MNNNNNLFDMFGVEKQKEPTQTQPIPPQEPTPIVETETNKVQNEIMSVVVEEPKQEEFKPIPDNIITPSYTNNDNSDKELLKLYVGPNYENIITGGFSFCTLFFGIYYLYYRKQHKYVLPLFIFQIIMSVVYGIFSLKIGFLLSFIQFVIYFMIAKNFKNNYIEEAKLKIGEIQNQTMNPEEQKDLIKKAGGVNFKVIFLLILLPTITTSLTLGITFFTINKTNSDFELHFPETFNETSGPTANSYKYGKYNYSDVVFNYRNNDNVCNFKFISNDEYTTKNIKENKNNIAKKYLKEKHSINDKLKKVTYNNNNYFYYYNEKEKTDYYLYITDKTLTELNIVYVKDTNKKCHEMTEYILNNSKKVK